MAETGRIFISYRRGDDAGFTQALFQRLENEFSSDNVFMDVEGHIKPGDDFVRVIDAKIATADVFLAIIGPRWSELMAPRVNDVDDFLQIEIRSALEQQKRVIPVLVGGAKMPHVDIFPPSVSALARRNAVGLRPDRFKADCQGLITAIKDLLVSAAAERALVSEEEKRAAELAKRANDEAVAQRLADADRVARDQALSGLSSEEIRKAEELANWKFVEGRVNVGELRDHLARFQNGVTSRYAMAKLEELLWSQTSARGDEGSLRAFLEEFPNGSYASIASKKLGDLRGDAQKRQRARTAYKGLQAEGAARLVARIAPALILGVLGAIGGAISYEPRFFSTIHFGDSTIDVLPGIIAGLLVGGVLIFFELAPKFRIAIAGLLTSILWFAADVVGTMYMASSSPPEVIAWGCLNAVAALAGLVVGTDLARRPLLILVGVVIGGLAGLAYYRPTPESESLMPPLLMAAVQMSAIMAWVGFLAGSLIRDRS